jgi:Ribosomal protein L11 methyltransferase (PrmA)
VYADERRLLSQHRELIGDSVRTNAFAEAIVQVVRPGDVVLDLGSGTGVLAMLAARAGARRVFAAEQGHIADVAAALFEANGCAVELFHRRSTEVELPERANVLITETLGNLGFDEQILPSVLDARRRLLTPDARIIPARVALVAAPVDAAQRYEREIAFWSERRYGIDFSPARTFAANQVRATELDESAMLAAPARLTGADFTTVSAPEIRGGARFTVARDGVVHGFGAWFVATLADGIRVSNEPPLRAPNWRQALLPIEKPVRVRRGDVVDLEIDSQDGANWRWRGSVAGTAFEQTTLFGFARCRAPR